MLKIWCQSLSDVPSWPSSFGIVYFRCGKKAGCCMHFRNLHIDNEYSAWRIYSCPNPIQTPEFMHLQLGKSFSSLEASSQMTTCFGFMLEHSWGFLFSSTFYLLSQCCNIAALTFLNPLSDSKSIVLDEDVGKKNKKSSGRMTYEEMVVPEVDQKLLEELEGMRFPKARATKALHYSGNVGLEDAMNWAVEHENDADIDQMLKLDVIGIDEAQFFDDLYDFCCKAVDCDGKIVIVAGLDGDYLRRTFGSVLHIIPLANSITKLTARCQLCGKRAFFTLRKSNETKTELIGGSDVYMPVCRQHYVNGQVVIESARDTLESCSKAQTDSYQEEVAVA